MDYRAVLIFLCVLIAQASCVPVGKKAKALNTTIQLMRTEIQTASDILDSFTLIPNISCLSLNITELVWSEQHLLTADDLSLFRCYMMKMSELTPLVSSQLQITSQYTQHVERLMSGSTAQRDCKLPALEQDNENYVLVRCLLQLLDQRFSEAKF